MKICPKCLKNHEKSGVFCSRSCANSRPFSKGEVTKGICNSCGKTTPTKAHTSKSKIFCKVCAPIDKLIRKGRYFCKICGQRDCPRPEVCKHKGLIRNTLVRYFTFNPASLGSTQVYEEWDRVKQLLYDNYIVKQKSSGQINKLYKYTGSGNLTTHVLKHLGIVSKSQQVSKVENALNYGPCDRSCNSRYKHGYHTSWEGKALYYRSSYELNYMLKLDQEHISYDNTVVRIVYWDTQLLRIRVAFPDFYLPASHTLVEIKGNYTYDPQNMLDREKAYKANGYNFELRLNLDKT